jgi:molybdopterin-binding protein
MQIQVSLGCAIDRRRRWMTLMEQSFNGTIDSQEIPGTVKEIISDKVLSEIIVETRIGEIASVITTRSVQDMGLKVGDRVAALVKATNVSLRRRGF